MSEPSTPRAFDRRGFLALIAGAVTALPAAAVAQTAATPTPAAATTPGAPVAPTPPEHSGNEARLLTEVLRVRYPDRFKEEQWTSIVSDIDGDLGGAKRLRATKLGNGDEPDFTFRP